MYQFFLAVTQWSIWRICIGSSVADITETMCKTGSERNVTYFKIKHKKDSCQMAGSTLLEVFTYKGKPNIDTGGEFTAPAKCPFCEADA